MLPNLCGVTRTTKNKPSDAYEIVLHTTRAHMRAHTHTLMHPLISLFVLTDPHME